MAKFDYDEALQKRKCQIAFAASLIVGRPPGRHIGLKPDLRGRLVAYTQQYLHIQPKALLTREGFDVCQMLIAEAR